MSATSVRNGLAAALLLPLVSATVLGQSALVGDWAGTLETPAGPLPVIFHVSEEDDRLTATLDSPSQGATGIPVSAVRFDPPSVELEVAAVAGGFTGEIDGDTLDGTWSQAGATLPLTLERGADPQTRQRPQDPRPPLPYLVEAVEVASVEGVVLAGELTRPAGDGAMPAVLLISGSGPQDRNETLMGHRPFLVLADHLSRQGIAVLRLDDRGVGRSTGAFAGATIDDFADDAAAAVRFLAGRPGIGPVGLVGHSEGGLVAPIVAAREAAVRFVVLLAAPGVPGAELLQLQNERVGAASGIPPAVTSANARLQRAAFEVIRTEPDPDTAAARLRELLVETLTGLGVPPAQVEAQVEAQLATLTGPGIRRFLTYDPAPALRALAVPVLAVNGTRDTQVPSDQNVPAIRAALAAGGNEAGTVLELDGLNHLFQTAGTGAPAEYATIEETIAPGLLDTLSTWVLEQTTAMGY